MTTYLSLFPGSYPETGLDWSPSTDPADDSPVWESLSGRQLEIHCRTYRNTEFDDFETAELTCVLANDDRALEPLKVGGENQPRKRIQWLLRDEDGVEYRRFLGFIRSIDVDWGEPPFATATIRASDYGLVLATTPIRIDGYPQETASARINRALDAASIPAGERIIESSDFTVAAIPAATGDQNPTVEKALEHCQKAAKSAGGYLFVNRDGYVVFHNARARKDRFGGYHGVFGDDEDSEEVVDEFDGSAIDTSIWTPSANANTPITVAGGSAVFTNNGSLGQSTLTHTSLVDWTAGGQFTLYSPTIPLLATAQRLYLRMRLSGDNNNRFEIRFQNSAGTRQVVATKVVAGVGTNAAIVVSDDYPYGRLRVTNGILYWEVSEDGIVWTQLASEPAPIAVTALQIQVVVGPQDGTPVAYTHEIDWAEIAQGEIPYQPGITGRTDDASIWTRHAVLTANDVREEHIDTAAATEFWESARDDFQSLLAYPGEAFAIASLTPWRYAKAGWRFPALVPPIANDRMTKAKLRAILSADVGSRFKFIRRPPEPTPTDPVEEDLHVEGMSEDYVRGAPYQIALSVSPADPELDEWVLGTSALGVDTYVGI